MCSATSKYSLGAVKTWSMRSPVTSVGSAALALCGLLEGGLAPMAHAQEVSRFDRERGRNMLQQVRHAIERTYYDSTFRGLSLADTAAALDARIQQATSLADILIDVARLPLVLNDSHTFLTPPGQTVRAEYGWDMFMVGDSCYVERVKAGSDAERQGVAPGDLVLSVAGYVPTRRNLWQIEYLINMLRPQRALHVTLQTAGSSGSSREVDLAARVVESKRIYDVTGLNGEDIAHLIREEENDSREMQEQWVEVGDVAVWRMHTFSVDASDVMNRMKWVRRHRALVLDLRGNQGGSVETLRALLGQLSRDDDTIGVQVERHKRTPMVARGAKQDAFMGPVVVLVDSRSASASEITARMVQLDHRGIIIGDRTAGAVMRGNWQRLTQGTETQILFGVLVTDADLVMRDGGRLEGVGVLPDTLVLPSGADLAARRDPVLARALTALGEPMDPAAAGALWRREE